MNRREILQVWLGCACRPRRCRPARLAQAKFPERPIKLMIPFSAGGVTDIVGRHWAERMKGPLGTIYVENQGGAAGTIGATDVARSPADGHSILLGNTSVLVLNPMTSTKLSYDPIKDFVPISILCVASVAWVVNASVPVKTLKEFVDYAKANPGKLSYGSAGTGTMTHLAAEQFKQATGLERADPRSVQGRGPGDRRSCQRPYSGRDAECHQPGAGIPQGRQGAHPRGVLERAAEGRAGDSDRHRVRLCQPGRPALRRRVRAGGDAEADRRADCRGQP